MDINKKNLLLEDLNIYGAPVILLFINHKLFIYNKERTENKYF